MRLLHTADWQLGLRLNFVGSEAAARLRAQRFETVRRIGALARERGADVVVVAGDVFDDNAVGADTVQQARDALEAFGEVPVVLLPGNHDPATPDSALARLDTTRGNVHVALEPKPLHLDALSIYPCPLRSRHTYSDPAAWLPAREKDDRLRIALAHGGALDFGETTAAPNRLDVAAILAQGFDYVALGDWHGLFEVEPRVWYPGAPEATRFKEKQPGYVLLVELDTPGARPRVEALPVARTRWLSESVELLAEQDVERLAARLDALEEKSWTLLSLSLAGQLSLAGRTRLDTLLADYAERLALLQVDTDTITAAPTAEDLESLRGEGYLGRVIDALRQSEDVVDTHALRLLYRLSQEQP